MGPRRVMSGGAEEPSPVKAFLSPLNLVEYRDLLKEQGRVRSKSDMGQPEYRGRTKRGPSTRSA